MIAAMAPAFAVHVTTAVLGVATLFVGAAMNVQRRRAMHVPLQALGATLLCVAVLVAVTSDTFDRAVDASWRSSFDAVGSPSTTSSTTNTDTTVAANTTLSSSDSAPSTRSDATTTTTPSPLTTTTPPPLTTITTEAPTITATTSLTTTTTTTLAPTTETTTPMLTTAKTTTETTTTTMTMESTTTVAEMTTTGADETSAASDDDEHRDKRAFESVFDHAQKRHDVTHAGHSNVHANGGVALLLAVGAQVVLGMAAKRTTEATDEHGRVRAAHRVAGYTVLIGAFVQLMSGVAAATDACATECVPRFSAAALALVAAVGYRQVVLRLRQRRRRYSGSVRALVFVESSALVGAAIGYVLEQAATTRTVDHARGTVAAVVAIAGGISLAVAMTRAHTSWGALDRGYLPSLAVFGAGVTTLATLRVADGDLERLATIELGLALLAAAIARVARRFDAVAVACTLVAVAAASAQFTAVRRYDGALAPSIASVVAIQTLVVVALLGLWTLGERAFTRARVTSHANIDDDDDDDDDDEVQPRSARRSMPLDKRIADLIAE